MLAHLASAARRHSPRSLSRDGVRMPFTPFHFGPGAVIKAVVPARFSFAVFCYSQIVTDLEPAYFMLRGEYPVHRFLHTYAGAAVVGLFCATTGRPICQYFMNAVDSSRARIPWQAAFAGALLGAFTHVFLDSIMHPDVAPLRPWTSANPMLHVIPTLALHILCVVLGVPLALQFIRKGRRS